MSSARCALVTDHEIVVTPTAREQIRIVDAWWRENRAAAPDLFVDELAVVLALLTALPLVGKRYPHPTVPGVRRLLLRKTRYHLYYCMVAETVLVLSIWSAVRGTGPDLGHTV